MQSMQSSGEHSPFFFLQRREGATCAWVDPPPQQWVTLSSHYDTHQSVTYQYREFPVPGFFHFFGGIGTNCYRKKVSEPVSEKFGTGKKSQNRYRKNLVPEKSLGTGIGRIWYRK